MGRPIGAKNAFSINAFFDAIKKVEKEKGKPFYEHVIERAYENDKVLCFVVNKVVPAVESKNETPDWVNDLIEIGTRTSEEEQERFKAYLN